MKAKSVAFTDHLGNRFIYPSMIIWPDEEAEFSNPTEADIILKGMTLSLATNTKMDKDLFEFDPETFMHLRTDIHHRGFMHGGATVYLFEGPRFEKYLEENNIGQ